MDRFKFRAWDKEDNKYVPVCFESEEDRYNKGQAVIRYSNNGGVWFSLSGYRDEDGRPYQMDCDIEQCVGTRDGQLELIWEGDVLEHTSGRRAKVVWKDSMGMFDLEALNDIGWVDDSICWWKWEKVGTVHDGQGGNG